MSEKFHALYVIHYGTSPTETGSSLIYLGKGKILGMDTDGVQWEGTYVDEHNLLNMEIVLTATIAPAPLVIGGMIAPGQSRTITVTLPSDFRADGKTPVHASVSTRGVMLLIRRIGAIP